MWEKLTQKLINSIEQFNIQLLSQKNNPIGTGVSKNPHFMK